MSLAMFNLNFEITFSAKFKSIDDNLQYYGQFSWFLVCSEIEKDEQNFSRVDSILTTSIF